MKHIVFTIDENFVRFCAVTMASVLASDKAADLTFHIVTDGLGEESRRILSTLAEKQGASVRFYEVSPEDTQKFAVRWEKHRMSSAAFYRCLLGDILPMNISKVLYLDCDLLVLGSLDELWNTELDGYALGAVPDDWTPNLRHFEQLGYDAARWHYINSGVLLINLDYWRGHRLAERFEETYRRQPRNILHDQDLINYLLHEQCRPLPFRWNVQEGFYRPRKEQQDETFRETILHPSILHYSSIKPWQYKCMHPLRHLYFTYQDLTPWKGVHPLDSRSARLHRFWHLLPYTLGWKRAKYIRL